MANITWDDDISSDVNEVDVQWDKKQWGGMPSKEDWALMPETGYIEGAKTGNVQPSPTYDATDPETGKSVRGYKFFNQFVPESGHMPLPPAKPPSNSLSSLFGQFAQGTKEGVAGLSGMPVDITNTMLGLAFGRTTGLVDTPIGGSKSIMNAFTAAGLPQEQAPEGLAQNTARAVGQQVPGLAVPAAMAGRAGVTAGNAIKTALPATVGAGTASGVARTVAPDQPVVDMLASIAGGMSPALLQTAATNWAKPVINSRISKTLNGVAPLTRNDLAGTGAGSMLEAQSKAVDGVKLITVSNQSEPFKYTDITGRVTTTGLPKSRMDFSQAIDQMKTRVYRAFNDMQAAAGKNGLSFSGDNLNARFNKFMENPDAPPSISDVANYMKRQMKKYEGQTFTPQQIESEIAHLNAKLRAYNKNPSPSLTGQATADDQILRILRDELDSGITNFEGPGYASFKNQYGSIRALQDRIGKSALAQLKEEGVPKKWYPDLTDTGMGLGSIVAATHSPSYAVIGGGLLATKKLAQHLTQPDRRIARMFSAANKVVKPPERWEMGTAERPMPTNTQLALGQPYIDAEIIPNQKQLPPMPTNRLEYTGRTGAPPIDAEWTPVHNPGSVATRIVPRGQQSVHDLAPFDFDATLKSLIDSGAYATPAEARNVLLQAIKHQLKTSR